MPFLEHRQRLYPLRPGENRLGAGPDCDVRLPELGAGREIRILIGTDTAELQGPLDALRVNGTAVTGPRPLRDQDRIELDGQVLVFLDDRTASAGSVRAGAGSGRAGAARGSSGSRPAGVDEMKRAATAPVLVRRDDGSVYAVDRAALKIGREKTCDIVIPDPAVSRLHAEVVMEGDRCLVRDLGRNGTLVNGEWLGETQPLAVGDVIGIGRYEFEFSRRPAAAVAGAAGDVTPIRAAIPDAPTVRVTEKPAGSGGWLRWTLILAVAAIAAAILLRL